MDKLTKKKLEEIELKEKEIKILKRETGDIEKVNKQLFFSKIKNLRNPDYTIHYDFKCYSSLNPIDACVIEKKKSRNYYSYNSYGTYRRKTEKQKLENKKCIFCNQPLSDKKQRTRKSIPLDDLKHEREVLLHFKEVLSRKEIQDFINETTDTEIS